MLTAKTGMPEMFGKWNFSKTAAVINGIVTLVSALLILHPKTFLWGNFLGCSVFCSLSVFIYKIKT